MHNQIENYLNSIATKYAYIGTSEMGYRTDFENLLNSIFESINVQQIQHDPKAEKGNKPDFVIKKSDVPILYIEAKDIGIDLDKVEKSDQMRRYFGYANLILTDYVEFRFYRNGLQYVDPIKIAEPNIKNRSLSFRPENYEYLIKTILEFPQSYKEPIKSGVHLSRIMGGKAQRIRDNTIDLLKTTKTEEAKELGKVFMSIKKQLIHDLSLEKFADMYAQTLVYGLFVARYHDDTLETFTRQEARDLIPASNPFLQHFFDHIVGPHFSKRLEYIVNELCEVFQHADVNMLMQEYFEKEKKDNNKGPDPVIHFYEDFLREYDPDLRKKMGAYYTPEPVVNFIVDSVDYLLKKEFGLASGLADTSKNEAGIHKVQILDPAVGTGTFITAVIRKIHLDLLSKKQEGRWYKYVHNDLLPRIHGFELMMAPYTIAHLKLSMAFRKTGFRHFNKRLGIYLTNALERPPVQEDIFSAFGLAESIAEESKEASYIKEKTPIMVILGNPPYNISSSNKGRWIQDLIKAYKEGLNERKINLDDDYIKFIRFAEHLVEKNKSGIVAMITNNSYIDGLTHRRMREHLLKTFNKIYILDLHGSTKKKEVGENGQKDENIFNIQQGVAISIFVKNKDAVKGIYFSEILGPRSEKYRFMNNMNSIDWRNIHPTSPNYFFSEVRSIDSRVYDEGFSVNHLFLESNSGVQTKNDSISIHFKDDELNDVLEDFLNMPQERLKEKYNLKDTSGWNIDDAVKSLKENYEKINLLYRPFDIRKSVMQTKSGGFIGRPRYGMAKNFEMRNLGLITVRQQSTFPFQHALVSNLMIESGAISLQTKEWGYIFPLYINNKEGLRISNLNNEIVDKIRFNLKIDSIDPESIFKYIYSILFSKSYRNKYTELLKIDFPRVPYPKDKLSFEELVKLGDKLVKLHLLEDFEINNFITSYTELGSDTVDKIKYEDRRVYINDSQYFGEVPEIAWNFYIGGYQPAQKWLKDRKGRTLDNEDIEHYQKMIVSLVETDKVMKQIDEIVKRDYLP